MFDVFIMRYRIPLDQISFYFIIVNFAVVGVLAIFYQTGIPMYITQTYLVFSSVIVAWQLSNFNSWTAWTLLVLLALYDLCAVLTPWGPLKFLVNLMSKDDAPDMPGLLYEASLPAGVERPGNQMTRSTNGNNNNNAEEVENRRVGHSPSTRDARNTGSEEHDSTNTRIDSDSISSPTAATSLLVKEDEDHIEVEVGLPQNPNILHSVEQEAVRLSSGLEGVTYESLPTIPLAIALIYRVDILSPVCYATADQINPLSRQGLSPSQLRSHVEVRFPMNGGKIIPTRGTAESNEGSPHRRGGNRIALDLKYTILDRHGNVKRVLVVDEEGKVFQETESVGNASNAPRQDTSSDGNSIKLGLGDFIFYSVLVAKASEFSFATFAACTLVILAGLGSTLILLSVYHQALPALPISIFLGVLFYLLTRTSIEPWIEAILKIPIYV